MESLGLKTRYALVLLPASSFLLSSNIPQYTMSCYTRCRYVIIEKRSIVTNTHEGPKRPRPPEVKAFGGKKALK